MKVSLVKDEKQSQTVGTVVYVLKLDEAAKDAEDIIRQGISLKKLIEQAGSNWNAHTGTTELVSLGIPVPKEKALGKNYVLMPDAYVELLISPFYEFSSDEKKLISISAELVAGAPWCGHTQKNRADVLELFAKFDKDTVQGGTALGALAHWYKPFPLVQAGEGKNRVSLAQEHNIPYLAQSFTRKLVPPNTLTIRRVFFSRHVLLKCSNAKHLSINADTPFRLNGGEFLIPFPELTVPLMKLYGVKERRGVLRFFIGYRFKRHMLGFLRSKSYPGVSSPWW
jgi:hypothetical protein